MLATVSRWHATQLWHQHNDSQNARRLAYEYIAHHLVKICNKYHTPMFYCLIIISSGMLQPVFENAIDFVVVSWTCIIYISRNEIWNSVWDKNQNTWVLRFIQWTYHAVRGKLKNPRPSASSFCHHQRAHDALTAQNVTCFGYKCPHIMSLGLRELPGMGSAFSVLVFRGFILFCALTVSNGYGSINYLTMLVGNLYPLCQTHTNRNILTNKFYS